MHGLSFNIDDMLDWIDSEVLSTTDDDLDQGAHCNSSIYKSMELAVTLKSLPRTDCPIGIIIGDEIKRTNGRRVSSPKVFDKHIVRMIPEGDSWLTSEIIEVSYMTLSLYNDRSDRSLRLLLLYWILIPMYDIEKSCIVGYLTNSVVTPHRWKGAKLDTRTESNKRTPWTLGTFRSNIGPLMLEITETGCPPPILFLFLFFGHFDFFQL